MNNAQWSGKGLLWGFIITALVLMSAGINFMEIWARENPVRNSGFDGNYENWNMGIAGGCYYAPEEGSLNPGSMKITKRKTDTPIYICQIITGYKFIPGALYSLTAEVKGEEQDIRGMELMIRWEKEDEYGNMQRTDNSVYTKHQVGTDWGSAVHLSEMPAEPIDRVTIYIKSGTIGDIWVDDIRIDLVRLPEGGNSSEIIGWIEPMEISTDIGIPPLLPDFVTVTYMDLSVGERKVIWDSIPEEKYLGRDRFLVEGSVAQTDIKAVAEISVETGIQVNPVYNSGFKEDESSWRQGIHGSYLYDSDEGKEEPGSIKMTRTSKQETAVLICQTIEGYDFIPGASYSLTANVKSSGADSQGVSLMIRWEKGEGKTGYAVKGSYSKHGVGTSWKEVEHLSEMPQEQIDHITIYIKHTGNGELWIDDVRIELVKLPNREMDSVVEIPEELAEAEVGEGQLVEVPEFHLSGAGAKWQKGYMEFHNAGKYGYYLLKQDYYFSSYYTESFGTFCLNPNRNYLISVLINNDFDRETEVDLGVHMMDSSGNTILKDSVGIPYKTDGWERYEFEFTSAMEQTTGQFFLQHNSYSGKPVKVRIADLTIIELPQKPLSAYGRGNGVTFRGGPGDLEMSVKKPVIEEDFIEIRTTGALYRLYTGTGVIEAKQLLEKERVIALWQSSLSLENLEVILFNNKECVLANEFITIGVQCDSLMMISPSSELEMSVTGKIGGEWNRYLKGHLMLLDDYGGMTVNPDIPLGSGSTPRTEWISGTMEKEDWEASWKITPGERLGITVFPPRAYDWETSFQFIYTLAHPSNKIEWYPKWSEYVNTVLLWNRFYYAGYAVTYGEYEVMDEKDYSDRIKTIKDAGMNAVTYMSPYFYQYKEPDIFMKQPEKFKVKYGIDGVYYDGIHSQDWVSGYEIMRMTRELFPDGIIILHTTGQAHNGGAPLAIPDIFIPAIDTYSTATLRGEGVHGAGTDWDYPKYITSQFRKANTIGIQKGDGWEDVPQAAQNLIQFLYNGRARTGIEANGGIDSDFRDIYYPVLKKLEKIWKKYGSDPDFFKNYYLPAAIELVEPLLKEIQNREK